MHDIAAPLPQTTPPATSAWPPPQASPPAPFHDSWTAWTLAVFATIWGAVALISVFSPDMITGSEQQRLPIAAFSTWLWGLGASAVALIVLARMRGDVHRRPSGVLFSGTTIVAWSAATAVSIFGPTMVTGTDPTTIPLAALIAPVVAMVATVVTGLVALVVERISRPHRP